MTIVDILDVGGASARLQVVSVLRWEPDVVDGCKGVSTDVHIVGCTIWYDSCILNSKKSCIQIAEEFNTVGLLVGEDTVLYQNIDIVSA